MQVKRGSGFTLIEILIIAPIVILFIGAFIGLIVGLTGESLQLRESNTASYSVQETLNDMEASTLQATKFLATTGAVQSPQGRDNNTTAFSNTVYNGSQALLLTSVATTKGPYDSSRSPIYTGTGTCDSNNPIYTYTTVYFVNSTDKALYKRTILPQTAACASAWQKGSCSENLVTTNTSVCKVSDERLLDNVSSMSVSYYADSASTTALALSSAPTATSLVVTINYSKQVAGKAISYSGSMRASSSNIQSGTPQTPPTLPPITWSSASNPYTTTFSWSSVGSATGYGVRYRIDGGTWQAVNLANSATTYDVTATGRKQVVDFELTVKSGSGDYLYGTSNRTIPRWQNCALQNNWEEYSSTYATSGFTRTTAGVIGLRGLIKNGTINDGLPVCTLPVGFRPSQNLIFQVGGYNGGASGSARVDIYQNGEVRATQGETNWVSLSGITFMASGAPMSTNWSNGTWTGGWSNYSADIVTGWGGFRYGKDTLGRVQVEGLGKPGTTTAGTVISNSLSPAGFKPSVGLHLPSRGSSDSAINISAAGSIAVRGIPTTNNYQTLSFNYYPATFTNWVTLPLVNSWTNYDAATWSPAQCYKGTDDLVVLRGLIKSGTSGTLTSSLNSVGCGIHTDGALIVPAWMSTNNSARVDIQTNGTLTSGVYSTTWTSLDGIRYIAD